MWQRSTSNGFKFGPVVTAPRSKGACRRAIRPSTSPRMVGMAEPSYRPDRFDVVLGRGATRDEIERAAWAKAKGAEGESPTGSSLPRRASPTPTTTLCSTGRSTSNTGLRSAGAYLCRYSYPAKSASCWRCAVLSMSRGELWPCLTRREPAALKCHPCPRRSRRMLPDRRRPKDFVGLRFRDRLAAEPTSAGLSGGKATVMGRDTRTISQA